MTRDLTKYRWRQEVYCKCRLVLAIVTDYVKQHPAVTYEELKERFPNELQRERSGRTKYDVFDTCDNIRVKGGQGKSSAEKRYFMKSEIICLQDGTKIAVCREWNKNNIEDFIAKAKDYQIMRIEN